MRTYDAPVILLALALAGCRGESPAVTAPDSRSFARSADAAVVAAPRPLEGRCEVTFTVLPSTPPVVRQADTGTCQLSHLGASTTVGAQTINFATLTQTSERTFTAANGDVLRTTGVGTSKPGAEPGTIDFDATLTVVGGTGRFANATGQVHDWGTANVVTRAVSFTLDGWVAYDASGRSDR
jgi:hypothetical protein